MADTPSPASPDRLIDVVVEIPKGSRNKYEYDHEKGIIRLDRRLFSATVYPADYGFVPDTLAEDGDPLDILVLLEDPTFPGCWVTCRPVGMLVMTDEKGPDTKLVAVEPGEPRYRDVYDIGQVQPELLEEIKHFFDVYKMLQPEGFVKTGEFEGPDAAWAEIEACRARYPGPGH